MASSEQKSSNSPLLIINKDEANSRLDRALCRLLGADKRTLILRLIRKGNVRINGKRCKPESRVLEGDSIFLPASLRSDDRQNVTEEKNLPKISLSIIYEDDDILVIDKAAGVVVHGGSGHELGLVEKLKLQMNLPELRLAHRLDRDTSGCLLLAKNLFTLRKLTESFREREAHKTYLAWVSGHPYPNAFRMQSKLLKGVTVSGERMVVDDAEGQDAVTDLQTILHREQYGWPYSLVALNPLSGRTHQLRVQLQQEGLAILGDPKYAEKEDLKKYREIRGKGLALHAWRLRFTHPATGNVMECIAPWPKRWKNFDQT